MLRLVEPPPRDPAPGEVSRGQRSPLQPVHRNERHARIDLAIPRLWQPPRRVSSLAAVAVEEHQPSSRLTFSFKFDLRAAALVDGLAKRHFVGHAAAGELRRCPSHRRLAFADDGRLVGH